jgi:MerR family transcriptional regulator, copper efflux regulator
MLIGEFAKASGLARDTIRFYEKTGLIGKTEIRRGANKYKHYDPALLDRMELIQKAKILGFTLSEIGKLIRDWEEDRLSSAEKHAIISDKIRVIDEKIGDLNKIRRYLEDKVSYLSANARCNQIVAQTNSSDLKSGSKPGAALRQTRT